MILKYEVNGDDLRLKSSVSQGHTGNVNTYICQFQFNEEWDGLTPFMAIKTGTRYLSPIVITDNQGVVPAEVLENQGVIQIGVYGTSGADATYRRISSGWITLHITEGAYCSGTTPEIPTPDVWEEYLDEVQKTAAESAEDVLEDLDARVTWLEQNGGGGGGAGVTVDSELDAESRNPVQNKVVTAVIEELQEKDTEQDTNILSLKNGLSSLQANIGTTNANVQTNANAISVLQESDTDINNRISTLDTSMTNQFTAANSKIDNNNMRLAGFDSVAGSVKTYIDESIQAAILDSWEVAV